MSQQNLRKSGTQCEVILQQPYERLVIDYNSECCRVISHDNYIKAECFSPKGNRKFRIRIEIESVADDEVSRPQNSIYVNNVFQYDDHCAYCQSNLSHPNEQHFYTTLSNEKANRDYVNKQREVTNDYASCDHVWKTDGDGAPYCRKCGNVKLTRRTNAESNR